MWDSVGKRYTVQDRMNETSSIKALVAIVALSAAEITTTFNNTGMVYDTSAILSSHLQDAGIVGTETIMPKRYDMKKDTPYNQAKQLFLGELRDFTKEEAIQYEKSLEKIYNPIGVNIFDLC